MLEVTYTYRPKATTSYKCSATAQISVETGIAMQLVCLSETEKSDHQFYRWKQRTYEHAHKYYRKHVDPKDTIHSMHLELSNAELTIHLLFYTQITCCQHYT